jgi:hypothetical protein
MASITHTTVIGCIRSGHRLLVDLRNELQRNPRVETIEKVTESSVGVGTTYHAKCKDSPVLDIECVEYHPPRRWSDHNQDQCRSHS